MERNSNLKERSQKLRKEATKEENLLWYCFLRKYPVRFRRQYIVGNYIVDFYCHQAKLVVELDGSGHYEPKAIQYDHMRTQYLESQGICVFRVSNLDVLQRFKEVCEAIHTLVESRIVES